MSAMQADDLPHTAKASAQWALIGDVGGTNCRLALADISGAFVPTRARSYSTDAFASLADAVEAYLRDVSAPAIDSASIAVAGPAMGDTIKLTNAGWQFSVRATTRRLGLKRLIVSNDLEAVGYAVLETPPRSLLRIGAPEAPDVFGPTAIVAPGTGLGVSLILPRARTSVLATEGGHVNFAPGDEVELELLRVWVREVGRVTNEHAISGPGIMRIYRGLAAIEGRDAPALSSDEIVARALAGEDALCVATAERFATILGSVAGDVVLTQGASAAVLTGSIVASLAPFLQRGGFRARFEQRGPGDSYLVSCPTLAAPRADLGLVGAFARLRKARKAARISV